MRRPKYQCGSFFYRDDEQLRQSCSIQYGHDKKIHLSGDLPIAPYYNGFLTAEEDGFSEHVVVE